MSPVQTYQESRMICPGFYYQKIFQKVGCFVRVSEMACDVLSGGGKNGMGHFVQDGKSLWDVCPGWQKVAWDVLSWDVLSGPHFSDM